MYAAGRGLRGNGCASRRHLAEAGAYRGALSGSRSIRPQSPTTARPAMHPPAAPTDADADADPSQFLHVASLGAGLASHEALWRWLAGPVQGLLPHELMLAAWGDFRCGVLQVDLVSSLPGLRTQDGLGPRLRPLVHYLRDCWVAARQAPCCVDVQGCLRLCGEGGAAPAALGWMRSAVVHATPDTGQGGERLFALLSGRPRPGEAEPALLRLLAPFIDTALRRLPLLRHPLAPAGDAVASLVAPVGVLSGRERQIMAWVALGKTNPEIGCILRISEFTVKNHMKSIFSKLDVTNRAQAVARLTRLAAHA
ncbi:XrtB/PEP-CTERM-associated transcriptional regulator EpsA [Ramlibacter sp. MAHUQ-53]|uniref:XrtB/PEP-CTERM-associated transcriptional regulator EpsA n=1 Tax=unclassified Ramlibacter TaxID=2617605 RepID=UPI0036448A44